VLARYASYENVNDADSFYLDPVMRRFVGTKAVKHCAASASAMGRFESATLQRSENLDAVAELPETWIDAAHNR